MSALDTALVHDKTIIDYLRVTHDDGEALKKVLRGPTQRLKGGVCLYPDARQDGFGTIFAAGGSEPRPFLLQLSGKPLAAWRAASTERTLVAYLAKKGVHCTRIDLARDTSGEWTPYRLREFLDADRYVSTWRVPTYIQQKGGPLTVQLGSRTSDIMLRCYDKRGQLLASGEPCPLPQLSRWELEIKGKLAPRAFAAVASLRVERDEATGEERMPLDVLHAAWLGKRLNLTSAPVDRDGKNQSRADTLPEWQAFMSPSNGAVLMPGADERTPAQVAEELARWWQSLAPSLTTAHALVGPDGIASLIETGRDQLSAKQRMLLAHLAETRPAARGILGL